VWLGKDGEPVSRNIERERVRMQAYLEIQDPTYVQELGAFNKNLKPMSEQCRVIVSIPARFEEKNLFNLLEQYSKQIDEHGQPLDPNLFEIDIIINRKEGESPDRSQEVISEWQATHPEYKVNAIDIEFAKEKANVGIARKYITDLSLLRATSRPMATGPLYVESEDADLFSVNQRTIATIIKEFDEHPHLDVLAGIQDRRPDILQKNDMLFFQQRLWHFMEMAMRKKKYRSDTFEQASFSWNRIMSCGWNTAYTAESYAQIGGYESAVVGEDILIGEKISLLRGQQGSDGRITPNTLTAKSSGLRSSSSPRRIIDTMAKEVNIYDDFENQTLKQETLEDLLAKIEHYARATQDQKSVYDDAIKKMFSFLQKEIPASESVAVLRTTLTWIGLHEDQDYTIVSGDTPSFGGLTNEGMQRIIGLFEKYREEKTYKKAYRDQNTPYEIS